MERGVHAAEVLLEHPMEHLPSVDDAPILKELKTLGTEKFQAKYAVETPVLKNGMVDSMALVQLVQSYVRPDYQWLNPFLDEHHIYWPAADYDVPALQFESTDSDYSVIQWKRTGGASLYKDGEIINSHSHHPEFLRLTEYAELESYMYDYAEVVSEFRESPYNKIWIPRQFHNLIHLITIPPNMPEFVEMKKHVRDQRRRLYLYEIANRAVEIQDKLERAVEIELPNGETVLFDKKAKKTYNKPEEMLKHRDIFVRQILKHHRKGLINLNELIAKDDLDKNTLEASLKQVANKFLGEDTVKTRMGSRALRVSMPTRPLSQSVWLKGTEEENTVYA